MASLKSASVALRSPTCVNKDACRYSFNFRTARIVLADPGTENVKVEVLQTYFRGNGRDSFSGDKIIIFAGHLCTHFRIDGIKLT